MKNSFVSGLVLSLLCINLALAETAYIKARQAKIYIEPSAKSDLVTSAQKGDAVEIIEQQGRWLKVSFDQHHGWVSSMLVGKTPPGDKVTVLDDADSLEQTARRRSSASTSAAAARGLRSDDRARQSDDEVADFGAVRQMESMGVTEDEAIEFVEQTD